MSRLAIAYTGMLMKGRRALARSLPRQLLHYIPGGSHALVSILNGARKYAVPQVTEWVQIQQGLSEGLWMNLDLARERTWWAGAHEPSVQQELRRRLHSGAIFYDVGAHIGFFTLAATRLGARVFAFEPDPENIARLLSNIKRNGFGDSVNLVDAALWSDSRQAVSFRRGHPRSQGGICYGNHRPAIASGESIQVRTISLDDFVGGGNPAPTVIKIDVEGAASEVLQGAIRSIEERAPILIIEVHTYDECAGVTSFLDRYGYQAVWNVPPEQFPRQCFACPSHSSG